MRKLFFLAFAFIPLAATAQMVESMKSRDPWRIYIFISTDMPSRSVIDLAREAERVKGTLVLRGFPDSESTLFSARDYAGKINRACCGAGGPGWIVHPKLFENFAIKATPAFVLSQTDTPTNGLTSIVSGDMAVSNALKFFAQESQSRHIRSAAARIYENAFKTQ